jgi:hypothetical protein
MQEDRINPPPCPHPPHFNHYKRWCKRMVKKNLKGKEEWKKIRL